MIPHSGCADEQFARPGRTAYPKSQGGYLKPICEKCRGQSRRRASVVRGILTRMGLLIDYFAASSDDDARTALAAGPGDRFPSTDGPGIEPVVNLGKLEELLTGKTFDQQLDDPASRPLVASANDGQVLVIKL
jgi:hypothetical protein